MTSTSASHATAWSALDIVGRQVVQFALTLVLARLISPADYGTFAIAAVFAAFVTVAIQGVLVTAIVRRPDGTDQDDSALFWLNLLLTAAAALLFVALAVPLAQWYGLQPLTGLMPAMALQVVLQAMGNVHGARLNRALRFRDLAKIGVSATVVSGLAAIAVAALGGGVWALATLAVLPALISLPMLWKVDPWRPRFEGLAASRDHWKFSGWLAASSVLEVAYSQGISLVIGKLHGARDTGLYNRAYGTQLLPGSIFSGVVARVLLPVAATVQHDPAALRQGLLKASRIAMVGYLPLMAGMAMTAEPLLITLFGRPWAGAAPLLAILAWSGAVYPLHVINLQILLAMGRSDQFFRLEVAKKAFGFPALVVGAFFGLSGLAWAQLAMAIAATVINTRPMGDLLDCGLGKQLENLARLIAATIVMVVALAILKPVVTGPEWMQLVILTGSGATAYVLACILLRAPALYESVDFVRNAVRAPRSA